MVHPDEFLLSFTWLLPNVLFIDERIFLGAARTGVGPALEGQFEFLQRQSATGANCRLGRPDIWEIQRYMEILANHDIGKKWDIRHFRGA